MDTLIKKDKWVVCMFGGIKGLCIGKVIDDTPGAEVVQFAEEGGSSRMKFSNDLLLKQKETKRIQQGGDEQDKLLLEYSKKGIRFLSGLPELLVDESGNRPEGLQKNRLYRIISHTELVL